MKPRPEHVAMGVAIAIGVGMVIVGAVGKMMGIW